MSSLAYYIDKGYTTTQGFLGCTLDFNKPLDSYHYKAHLLWTCEFPN